MNAVERMVVQTTLKEKQALIDEARHRNISVSELMRTGATAYTPADADLVALATAAQASAQRSIAAIEEALASPIDVAQGATIPRRRRLRPTLSVHFGT